jgi:protein subunit release factor B
MFRLFATLVGGGIHRTFIWPNVAQTSLRAYIKEPDYPPLNEAEIREIFTKGSGPGGQKLNKATNRCELKHLPTGNL